MTFAIGDTVRVTGGNHLPGSVGTVVHLDESRDKILVRINHLSQDYVDPGDLEIFDPSR